MADDQAFSDDVDEPSDVLRNLIAEWEETARGHERQAESTDGGDARRHRGRAEALQQGVRRLNAQDLEADPIRAAGQVWGRLHNRTVELGRLINERAPLEDKHRAIRTQMEEMMDQLDRARRQLDEMLGEAGRSDPDDWEWVSEEVRERLLEAWGYKD